MPKISVIILSHDKPKYVTDAIRSVRYQIFKDWDATIWDSGVLYDSGFFEEERVKRLLDDRFSIVRSSETEDVRKNKVIASWCFNQWIKRAKGEWLMYLCDDDKYFPTAFRDFADYAKDNQEVEAMYGAADFEGETGTGEIMRINPYHSPSVDMKGQCCEGAKQNPAKFQLFHRVDSIQICHKKSVLKRWGNEEYWSEDRVNVRHADGVFMEKLGSLVPIYPIGRLIGVNRKVCQSINDPMGYI